MNCLNCGKPLGQTEGKREKKYCDNNCRAIFHQKKNAGIKKYVRIETYESLLEENKKLKELASKSAQNDKKPLKEGISTQKEQSAENKPENDNSDIVAKIEEIKKEKIQKERDTPLGRKIWAADQQKRILELEKQLHG